MIYRIFTLLSLAALAVAAWLTFDLGQSGPGTALVSRPPAAEQGYAAQDVQVVETGPDGTPMYTLQAQNIQQDPQSNVITLHKVHMIFHDQAGGRWQATADEGRARQDSAQIDLSGSVNGSGTFSGSTQPVHFLTDTLRIDTRTDIIRTPDPVALDWAGQVMHARGLFVSLKDHHVKFEADVHGRFLP